MLYKSLFFKLSLSTFLYTLPRQYDILKLRFQYWDRNEQAIPATSEKYGRYCTSIAQNILDSKEDVEEARTTKVEHYHLRNRNGFKWGMAAACLCLILLLPMILLKPESPAESPSAETEYVGPPHFTLDGRTFFVSSHISITDELPDGFTLGGTADIAGIGSCSYYLNPAIPEWVYVCQEVYTDDTVDETGSLYTSESLRHDAYVRYVDERLRGKDFVSYDNCLYISMWSSAYYGDEPDVSREFYDAMKAEFGMRIEQNIPEGFSSAGVAQFSGLDTIPTGKLSSNTKEADVLVNPDNPDVVLVSTHWHTATAEENGETKHTGYDVYIRYDGSLNGQ